MSSIDRFVKMIRSCLGKRYNHRILDTVVNGIRCCSANFPRSLDHRHSNPCLFPDTKLSAGFPEKRFKFWVYDVDTGPVFCSMRRWRLLVCDSLGGTVEVGKGLWTKISFQLLS